MLSLLHLNDAAYGVSIRDKIEQRARRRVSMAAVYAALDRLERGGYVESWMSEPLPERGGRARKHFRLQARGVEALDEARATMRRMWRGVELPRDAPTQ